MSGMNDQMTSVERLKAYAKSEGIDRLPCVPIVGNTAARVIGEKVSSLRRDGKLLAQAHVESQKLFGYDNIRIFTDLYVLAEAMGSTVQVPEDETAFHEAPAIENIADIGKLHPVDPWQDEPLPVFLEAMKIAADQAGDRVPVTGALTGPFTNASFLIGTERLARLMLRDPDLVHQLCEISLQSAIEYARAIIGAGCAPSLTDPVASGTVISKKCFETFALPYLKRLISFIHDQGKSVTLHICGNTRKIWDLMADSGADCLSIDNEVSLLEAKHVVGDRVRLMGNVRPTEVMYLGTPEVVKAATLNCVRDAGDSPKGLVVASGCSLPTETPFENIHAMMNAVREAGYPPQCE
jgi:uroporphyrinogen decarboxylase